MPNLYYNKYIHETYRMKFIITIKITYLANGKSIRNLEAIYLWLNDIFMRKTQDYLYAEYKCNRRFVITNSVLIGIYKRFIFYKRLRVFKSTLQYMQLL